ncbi:MAG TPA: tetratricopeptide repeat protein [Phycisphaerae bacterium]|nr:tetratricopeptide repeat protein [Phycisphaerae bacterium]
MRKWNVFLALMLACGVSSMTGCGLWPKPKSTTDLYLEGQLEAERGNYDAAMASLSKAIEKNPQMSLAYEARGSLYKEKGDYAKAASDYKQAAKLEPFNFNAHYELGLMYQYLQRFAEAVIAYQKAVEIRPLDPEANMNLAMTYTEMGEPLRGLPYAQRAVQGSEQTPSAATSYANLGILYAQLGKNEAAIDALKHSIELNSRQPEVYLNLGQEYIKAEKYEQAKNVLETARDLAPSAAISERLGLAYYKLRNLPKSHEAFDDSIHQNPQYYPALNGLGVVAMTTSQMSAPPDLDSAREALAYWDRSLKINPQQPAIQMLVKKYTGK